MQIIFPVILVGGLVGWALHQPHAPTKPALPEATAPLGGYLQAAHAVATANAPMAQQGLLAALVEDPNNLQVRKQALEAALANTDLPTAARLAKTLPTAEQPSMARLLLITDAIRTNDLPLAKQKLRSLISQNPDLPALRVLDAYMAAAGGVPTAKLVPLVLAKAQPWAAPWHSARLWLNAQQPLKALGLLQPAVAANPGALPSLALLQSVHLALGLPAKNLSALQQTFTQANPTLAPLMADPIAPLPATFTLADNTAAALMEFALVVWAEGAPPLALQLIVMAEYAGPTEPFLNRLLLYYKGVLQETIGAFTEAEQSFQGLVDQGGGMAKLAQSRLIEIAYQQAATLPATRAAADRAWALAKANPSTTLFMSSALQLAMAAEQYPRAAKAATKLLETLPQQPSATLALRQSELYFARGAAFERAKKYAAAQADLMQAVSLNPANAEALNYLGYMWVDLNQNLPEAYALLKRAHLLAPNNGAITDSVGWAYYRKGDYEVARQYLELAAEQEPGLPEILSHLADTYAKLGNQAEAEKLWRRALELAEGGAEVPSAAFVRELRKKVK